MKTSDSVAEAVLIQSTESTRKQNNRMSFTYLRCMY